MDVSFTRTCTIVWIVLLLLTVVSGFIADGMPGFSSGFTAVILLVIALIKVRLVIIHFMEIGHAALPLRIILEAWVFVTFAVLAFLYFSPAATSALAVS